MVQSPWKLLLAIALCLCGLGVSAQEGRKVIANPEPAYPALARRMNLSGVVKVEVTVAPNGEVKDAKVLGGHPVLADAALSAIKNWHYEKANTETKLQVEFRFHP